MVDFDPAFRHDLLQITVRNSISDIEEHRVQDDDFRIVATFDVNRHDLIPTCQFKERRLSQVCTLAHILKLCDRTHIPTLPPPWRPQIAFRLCVGSLNNKTAGQRGLIGAPDSGNMHEKAFYLGNVGSKTVFIISMRQPDHSSSPVIQAICGYRCRSFVLASSVVKCHLVFVCALFRFWNQAVTSVSNDT